MKLSSKIKIKAAKRSLGTRLAKSVKLHFPNSHNDNENSQFITLHILVHIAAGAHDLFTEYPFSAVLADNDCTGMWI